MLKNKQTHKTSYLLVLLIRKSKTESESGFQSNALHIIKDLGRKIKTNVLRVSFSSEESNAFITRMSLAFHIQS